jgi:hypothetical protein
MAVEIYYHDATSTAKPTRDVVLDPSLSPSSARVTSGPYSMQQGPQTISSLASSGKKRRLSKVKTGKSLARSISTPQLRGSVMSDSDADKKRNKLGYQRISIACGTLMIHVCLDPIWLRHWHAPCTINVTDPLQLIVEDERFDAWLRLEIRDQDAKTAFDSRKSAYFILLSNKVPSRTSLSQARLLAKQLEHLRLFRHLRQKPALADHLRNVKKSLVLQHCSQTRLLAFLVSRASQVAAFRAKVSI